MYSPHGLLGSMHAVYVSCHGVYHSPRYLIHERGFTSMHPAPLPVQQRCWSCLGWAGRMAWSASYPKAWSMGSCHTPSRAPTQKQIAQSLSPEPKVERRHRHLATASNLPSAPSLCPAFRFLCRFALDILQMLGFIALVLFQPLGPAYPSATPRAASEPGGAALEEEDSACTYRGIWGGHTKCRGLPRE